MRSHIHHIDSTQLSPAGYSDKLDIEAPTDYKQVTQGCCLIYKIYQYHTIISHAQIHPRYMYMYTTNLYPRYNTKLYSINYKRVTILSIHHKAYF